MTEPRAERLIAGMQAVREAIRARPAALDRVAVEARDTPRLEALVRFARDQGVARLERLPRRELDRLAGSVEHQGALAWGPPLALTPVGEVLAWPGLLALALDGIQDPQNFGAVVRSAVALAGAPILWGEHASAPLGAATGRASAGAIEHATLCRVPSLPAALEEAAEAGATVVGLDPAAPLALASLDLRGPTVLVIGSEHTGMHRSVRRACGVLAHLVPPGRVQSLNASVAAGIALYEAAKQRVNSAG
ncbi:MAG: RNA methyltransferase [Sorangiineae bacterium]|nr:RNA methyltransferase [Polyangiaceae bacterium]MEB2324157.1 RNA methyltransferase [Sorangiineae bacterium]